MEPTQKLKGDRLVLGMLSAFRTLVWTLSKNGAIDLTSMSIRFNRQRPNTERQATPNNLANAPCD